MKTLPPLICKNYTLQFTNTNIMGILNLTPDSFYDGGFFTDEKTAVQHARQMVKEGADCIDVGAESTRPGATALSEKQELERLLPVIERLVKELSVPISIDTYKPRVADTCLRAGAHLINDITGLTNPQMRTVVAEHQVPVVIMHMKGTPQTMQQNPVYGDVTAEIIAFFKQQITAAKNQNIHQIIIDPGIGFGKNADHNLQLLKHLSDFQSLGSPILIGPSRKSFIGQITSLPPAERLSGTLAAISIGIMNGANIIRVHDVKQCKQTAQIVDAIRGA